MENARRRAKRTAHLRLVTFGNLLVSTGSQMCKVQSTGKCKIYEIYEKNMGVDPPVPKYIQVWWQKSCALLEATL